MMIGLLLLLASPPTRVFSFVLYVTHFTIECGGPCDGYAQSIRNDGSEAAVCGVGAVSVISYDFALCPGQLRQNHHWRGTLTCVQAPDLDKCGGTGKPVS